MSSLFKVFLFCFSLTFLSARSEKRPDPCIQNEPEVQSVIIIDTVIYSPGLESNLLGDSPERKVMVYLPPEYYDNPDKRYPVLYLLHGFTRDYRNWEIGIPDLSLKRVLTNSIDQGLIKPMIVVSPDSKNQYRGSFYANSTVTGNWEDFIVQDVVQFMDETFRTIPHADSRGIAGHSMGGHGAMKLAMKHPSVFCAVYAFSGALISFEDVLLGTMKEFLLQAAQNNTWSYEDRWEVKATNAAAVAFAPDTSQSQIMCRYPITVNGEVIDSIWQIWLGHDPSSMIPAFKDSLMKLKAIQFDCGKLDLYQYLESTSFSKALDYNNIEHQFNSYEGDHSDGVGKRMQENALPFFSDKLVHE